MLRADFHSHTTYCDGKSTTREMVESAFRKGMTDFGISGHADFSFCTENFGMQDKELERYTAEILSLREEFRGRMNIYTGIELDCLGPIQKAEYAIGSTHCIYKNGVYVEVDESEDAQKRAVKRLWNGDWYAFARDYYELEATVYEKTGCDWVGHFDLLTKFNEGGKLFDETRDEYLEPALCAMKRLNGHGLPFEINTGAISRGYRTDPYPNKILLKELRNMGGRIIINSDSHHSDHIGFCFDRAVRSALECGFTHTLVLAPGGGFREIALHTIFS